MRTFIALNLSDEMKEELFRIQEELKKADTDVKWNKPHNIHITLKFLGEIDEAKVVEIKGSLDSISREIKPFDISLFKLGAFPNLNQLRVLWVGLDKGCSEVDQIAASLENNLEKIGFLKEDRPFSAHLTLGRVRSGRNKAALKEKLSSLEVQPKSSRIDNITLYQSTLTQTGPIYTPLHVAKFV